MREFVFRTRSYARPVHSQSLADTKLAEHGVENLFHVDYANDFAESAQRLIQVNRNVLRRQSFAHGRARAIAGFQRPAQAIAMASIDRDCAFRSEILLPDARQNLLLQFRQAVAGQARNTQSRKIFPVAVLGQITLVQNNYLVRVARLRRSSLRSGYGGVRGYSGQVGPVKLRKLSRVKMRRLWRVAICDVKS